ncbi:MAG: UbiD family decarboxylase [Candidatus Altiarchaeales archaeon]|nr:UbiD family decarboxylase [Candidatus Altiarchaeales archaeon]MBD3416166.1 UbiD family decarboxylase [Candidatus Altiarchaeales archaeon]
MSLRDFIGELEREEKVIHVTDEVDPKLEAAKIIKQHPKDTILFEKVKGSEYRVVAGVCASRDNFARAMGIERDELLFKISEVIDKPTEPKRVEKGVCQEVVEKEADLSRIPILTHASNDLGPYISAGVWIANDEEWGLNADYHRASPVAKDKLVARICHRDLYKYMQKNDPLEVAICLGLHPTVSLAASISTKPDVNELAIANSMKPVELVKCKTIDVEVPADAELVLEGTITASETHEEGPFPDISGTFDKVRDEPVFTVKCITHRKDPIYQGLLPAYNEHRLLMGMPKEPTIYRAVNEVANCKNVMLSPGGCSWLHAIVQIEKKNDDDGIKAGEAAFKGHGSLKHCIVVDDDIDIYDLNDLEWAIATRCQMDKDAKVWQDKGSSLDASACKIEGSDRLMTAKVALDATIPWDKDRDAFLKANLGE